MRLFLLAAAALAALLPGCDTSPAQSGTAVEDARVQLPPVPGRPGSAYFTLAGKDMNRLVGVASPRVERIELHESVTEGGVARMRPAQDLAFGKGRPLAFAPGGRHAMLFGIDPALESGDTIPLTFTVARGPAVTVQAKVEAFGAAGHEGH